MKVAKQAFPVVAARRPVLDNEYIYNEMKQMLMIGEFVPGQKLTLPQLAEAFGTSQMPIREATNRLIAVRALQAPPRRSLCVPDATLELMDSLLPLRILLEGEATRLAVHAKRRNIVTDLEKINEEMVAASAEDDLKTYLRLNQKFHFTIYKCCGNIELVDLIELLWMRYAPMLNIARGGVLSTSGRQRHREIVEAFIQDNANAAAIAMQGDISDAARPIRELLTVKAP